MWRKRKYTLDPFMDEVFFLALLLRWPRHGMYRHCRDAGVPLHSAVECFWMNLPGFKPGHVHYEY